MPIEIIERTVRGETDKRISLYRDHVVRPITIGNSWQYIKIGIRFSLNVSETLANSPPIYLGLVNVDDFNNIQPEEIQLDNPNCKHFLGLKTNTTNWVLNTSTTYGNLFQCGLSISKIENGQEAENVVGVQGGTTSNSPAMASTLNTNQNNALRSFFGVIIRKNTITNIYNVELISSYYSTSTTRSGNTIDYNDFIAIMGQEFLGDKIISVGNTNIPINETLNGELNSVIFSWRGILDYKIEISDIAYSIK